MYGRGCDYYFEVRPYNYRTGWGSWISSDNIYFDDYCREYAYRDYYRYDRKYPDRYGVSYARNPGPPYNSQTYSSNGYSISNNDTINGFFPTGTFMNVYGTWKYAYINGAFATNTWIKSSGKWYYIDVNGNMVTGPYTINGKTYYLNADGYMAKNSWRKDSKGWCWLGADGSMVTNAWEKDSGGWCFIGSDGHMVTDSWADDSKGRCWMDSTGHIAKSRWLKEGGDWYYLKADGYMATGNIVINGKTYRFDSDGKWLR